MLLHLCEQSFSDMIGNTNEPSTRVRVSNLGAGGKGGYDATVVCNCFICSHTYFLWEVPILKAFLKVKVL